MRINKFISSCGVCSRRGADRLVKDGKIKVNGVVLHELTYAVKDTDQVEYAGKIIKSIDEFKIWRFYKPVGLITTHKDEQGRDTVFDYLKQNNFNERVMSVGRLDLNSEGLLLLSNDASFIKMAESPETKWERCYRVRVYGDTSKLNLKELIGGAKIDGINYQPIKIELGENVGANTWLQLTLTEGKNREIRKIMEHYGLQVNRLIRYSYGPYELGNLKSGEFDLVKKY